MWLSLHFPGRSDSLQMGQAHKFLVCDSCMAEVGGALCRKVLWDTAFCCSTSLAQAGSDGVGAPNWRVTLVFWFLPEQVAADQCRRLIQDAVLKPEVRRYMFYNSRAFQIAIAVVRTAWCLAGLP